MFVCGSLSLSLFDFPATKPWCTKRNVLARFLSINFLSLSSSSPPPRLNVTKRNDDSDKCLVIITDVYVSSPFALVFLFFSLLPASLFRLRVSTCLLIRTTPFGCCYLTHSSYSQHPRTGQSKRKTDKERGREWRKRFVSFSLTCRKDEI